MKKILSCLLVAAMLVSIPTLAFAAGNITGVHGAEFASLSSAVDGSGADVKSAVRIISYDKRSNLDHNTREQFEMKYQNLIGSLAEMMDYNYDLHVIGENSGVEVSDFLFVENKTETYPLQLVMKVKNSDKLDTVALFTNSGVHVIHDAKAGETVVVTLNEPSCVIFFSEINREAPELTEEETTVAEKVFVGSAEAVVTKIVKVNGTSVKQDAAPNLVITAYDKRYSLPMAEREQFGNDVTAMLYNFDVFTQNNSKYSGTAVSEAFYASTFGDGNLELPATVSVQMQDADIFCALLHYDNNQWIEVPASVDNPHMLTFSMSDLGIYVVLSAGA